jgi:hypothetical protein
MTTEKEAWNKVFSKANLLPKQNMTPDQLKAVGLPADATEEQYNAKVAELVNSNKTAQDALAAELDKKVTNFVDNAIKAGKIKVEARAESLKLAKSNFEDFEKVVANMNVRELPSNFIGDRSKEQNPQNADRKDWTFTDWTKKDTAGLLKMKAENPAEYQSLFEKTGVKITENQKG